MDELTFSETELLQRAKNLDSSALAHIYDRYSPDIYRYAIRLLGDTSLAEDCVSETFNRFLHAIASGKGPYAYLRAYLYRIAHNWITDQYRRGHPTEELSETFPDNSTRPEETADYEMQNELLLHAIRELTDAQQQVIILKFWQDLENEDIARAMGLPVGVIKSRQHRALVALKRKLEKEAGRYE